VQNWQLWAAAAAVFAALPALLIKLGVQAGDAGMATLFRALAVAIVPALVLLASGRLDWPELRQLPALSMGALAGVQRQELLQPPGAQAGQACNGNHHVTSSIRCGRSAAP